MVATGQPPAGSADNQYIIYPVTFITKKTVVPPLFPHQKRTMSAILTVEGNFELFFTSWESEIFSYKCLKHM